MNALVSTEKLVPDVYLDSRDFKVFLKLLEMIKSTTSYDLNNWIKLYSPTKCPAEFLNLIADFVGYEYNTNISIAESRIIISNFVNLLKNRGSKLGFEQAISIVLNAQLMSDVENEDFKDAVNQLGFLEIYFNYDTGKTQLFFPKRINYNEEIFNYIRPIGTYIELITTEMPEPESDVAVGTNIETNIRKNFKPYVVKDYNGHVIDSDRTYGVNSSLVNLSQLGKIKNLNVLKTINKNSGV